MSRLFRSLIFGRLKQVIRAIAINPTGQIRIEDRVDSLEVGKYAELVVLDKIPFDIHPTEISDANVPMTLMDVEFSCQKAVTISKQWTCSSIISSGESKR